MSSVGYAVIDFETTGLSPRSHDRVIEVAIVHVDPAGEITGSWETLINPNRDLGRTDIHRITARQAAAAPPFEKVAPQLIELLEGRVVVAHNASFDSRFLQAELARIGYVLPSPLVTLCTMNLARTFLPGSSRKLAACCEAFDIPLIDAHRASADARATALLLAQYLRLAPQNSVWTTALSAASQATWPRVEGQAIEWQPRQSSAIEVSEKSFLEQMTERMPMVGSVAAHDDYLALLDTALLDRHVSRGEREAMDECAESLGLSPATRAELHHLYFASLVDVAWADSLLTDEEASDLREVAKVLSIAETVVNEALTAPGHAKRDLGSVPGELAPGALVVLTGEMNRSRSAWEAELSARGYLVWPAVTKKVALVVAADLDTLSGKAKKAREYGIPVVTEDALTKLLAAQRDASVGMDSADSGRRVGAAREHESRPSGEPRPVPVSPTVSEDMRELMLQTFMGELRSGLWGMQYEVLTLGTAHVVLFYRPDINFALAHNRVSILAGIGIMVAEDGNVHRVSQVSAQLASAHRRGQAPWMMPDFQIDSGTAWVDPSALRWDLPTDLLIDVNEAQPDSLRFTITVGEHTAEIDLPVRILAHDQWTPTAVPEIIAAFVRPRSEVVNKILSRTSDLLFERTSDPSLVGYQDSAERVRMTAHAIYDAIRELDIRYAEPPASFESTGQRVRSANTVVVDRFGTCLDTTVLFASVLEEAGISPFVVILPGHALVGFTDQDIVTDMVLSRDATSNILFGNLFYPIETTVCTAGKNESFEEAIARGRHAIERDGEVDIDLMVNVKAAHRRIQPLPMITTDGEKSTILLVEERMVQDRRSIVGNDSESGQTLALLNESFPYRVSRWRSELLDLTFRNPLLKLSESRALKFIIRDQDLGAFEDRLASGESIAITPHEAIDDIDRERGITSVVQYGGDVLSRLFHEEHRIYVRNSRGSTLSKLNSLRRAARTLREDTGATALFVSLGILNWRSSGRGGTSQVGRSPLFLLPVELTGSASRPYAIRVEPNSEIQPNISLIEKLYLEYGLSLPQLENPPTDESGIDLNRVFTELRQTFLERGLEFSIDGEANLGIFHFASLDMWRDVTENWQELATNAVVDHLIHRPGDVFASDSPVIGVAPTDEADLCLPMPADGSQIEAVKATSAGHTFVLEGPPGTGKSQTITNMIADGLAQGRSILFVAEKQAALSVVKDRLSAVGLDILVLDVHSKDQSLNGVRQQLKRSISAVRRGSRMAFETEVRLLRDAISELQAYPEQIHSAAHGRSVWDQHQQLLALRRRFTEGDGWHPHEIIVPPALRSTDISLIREHARAVHTTLQRTSARTLAPEWTFISTGAAENFTVDFDQVLAATAILSATVAETPSVLLQLLDASSVQERVAIEQWLKQLSTTGVATSSETAVGSSSVDGLSRIGRDLAQFQAKWQGFASSLTTAADYADIPAIRSAYQAAATAGFMSRSRLVKSVVGQITALAHPGAAAEIEKDPHRFLSHLESYLREYRQFGQIFASSVPGPTNVHLLSEAAQRAHGAELATAQEQEKRIAATNALVAAVPHAASVVDSLIQTGYTSRVPLYDRIALLDGAWNNLATAAGTTPDSKAVWLNGLKLYARIAECAPTWSTARSDEAAKVSLDRTVRFHTALEHLRGWGLGSVAAEIRDGRDAERLADAIEIAVCSDRLSALLRVHDLDVYDSHARQRDVEAYSAQSKSVRNQLRAELPAQLLKSRTEKAPASVGLRKEVDRKRGGSIRSLFEAHGSEILNITPVVMMSPAAVARFLPVGSVKFDTVIFDEASQIRVADAVGALGRASSAVVVGDSRQMPPTNTFAADTDQHSDDSPSPGTQPLTEDATAEVIQAAGDQESILSEAVGSGLERKWLTWHYRSRHESLISFSNAKYYDSNLQVFPSPPGNPNGLGVSAVYVGGVFDRGRTRTNEAEATAIVEDLTERLTDDPAASIGVVTFNTQQRDLILDKLEQSPSASVRRSLERDAEPVFVKNLENVQGDERDVILFSIAFSRVPDTGQLPHNFGPLNSAGGERRLNVAITRARNTVVLYTSIRSSDLSYEKSKADGVAHLKQYLAYAEGAAWERASPEATSFASEDLYREDVAQRLRDVGLEVETDIGTSRFRVDLGVRASTGHSWLALLLDSPEWAHRKTPSDRDALPSDILCGVLGWQDSMQLLLPAWISSPEQVVAEVSARAHTLTLAPIDTVVGRGSEQVLTSGEGREVSPLGLVSASSEDPPLPPHEAPATDGPTWSHDTQTQPALTRAALRRAAALRASQEPEHSESEHEKHPHMGHGAPESAATVRGERPYAEASTDILGPTEILDNLDRPENLRLVKQAANEIIDIEGPIESNRLVRLVLARFGMQRAREARVQQVLRATPRAAQKDPIDREFFWARGARPASLEGFRTREHAGVMPASEISTYELLNAFEHVLRESGPLRDETLVREVMGIFGWSRLGAQINERLTTVIQYAIRKKRVMQAADRTLTLPGGSANPSIRPEDAI